MEYKIYQIHDDAKEKMFFGLSHIGGTSAVKPEDYITVYQGRIEGKPDEALERLWFEFNENRPQDFFGRSLSVSDIVAIDDVAYFCDSIGWVEVPDFVKNYDNASLAVKSYRIRKEAAVRARHTVSKLCNSDCVAGYSCTNKLSCSLPLVGKETTCPLAKYHVPSVAKTPFFFGDSISLHDLDDVCINCEHCDLTCEQGQWMLSFERSFETCCIDCPIQACRENIIETMAETSMS